MLFLVILAVGMMAALPFAGNHILLIGALILWGVAYTALLPVCQVRAMNAGAKAQALAATMNISAANAGIGLGAIFGGLGIGQFGLGELGWIATAIAALAIIVAVLMMRKR